MLLAYDSKFKLKRGKIKIKHEVVEQKNHLIKLKSAIQCLENAGLLTELTSNLIASNLDRAEEFIETLKILDSTGLLKEPYLKFSKLIFEKEKNAYVWQLAVSFRTLKRTSILNDITCKLVLSKPEFAREIATSFSTLKSAGIYNEKNCIILLEKAERAKDIAISFRILKRVKLFNDRNCNLVFHEPDHLKRLVEAYQLLNGERPFCCDKILEKEAQRRSAGMLLRKPALWRGEEMNPLKKELLKEITEHYQELYDEIIFDRYYFENNKTTFKL